MFKATVENPDSSISPRSISAVESRTCSLAFSSSTGCGIAVDGASKSPNGVTEDANVDPDRNVASLSVGAGANSSLKESVSRGSSDSSSPVLRLSLPEPESNKRRKVRQRWRDRILSLNGRTEFSIVSFIIRHLNQLNKGRRDLSVRHQEQP